MPFIPEIKTAHAVIFITVMGFLQFSWVSTGGSVGVRDEGLLDSALEGAFAGFGDREFYPTKEEKGARLGYTLISNHAFIDGNKRIGVYIMLSFLEMNGIRLQCTDDELVDIGLSVASGRMKYEELLQWVLDHKA